jgi:hypothetical protein
MSRSPQVVMCSVSACHKIKRTLGGNRGIISNDNTVFKTLPSITFRLILFFPLWQCTRTSGGGDLWRKSVISPDYGI